MHLDTGVLAVAGSLCMMLALVLAWCLAGARSSRLVKRCVPNPQDLLKAHLDFLMMTGLLFVFFLLFEHLRLTPPTAFVVAMSLGSVGNSSGFLALAVRPDLPQRPATPSCQGFGDRPFVVVTAARDAQAGCVPLQEEMATLSTNSSHRVVPYTHDALITDQTAAQTSSQAILGVVHAVRFGSITKKS
jgi:hypothetical protein